MPMQNPTAPARVETPSDLESNPYGRFSDDGTEYLILRPDTPRPWVNVAANERFGFVVSQAGGGFTWIDNSQLAMLTRWHQDLTLDAWGKFAFVRDADGGRLWSLAPAPCRPAYDRYQCRHGLGYTVFQTRLDGIEACWTLVCDPHAPVEWWFVTLRNTARRSRRLELTAYLEWNCGAHPGPQREFHKLFVETGYDEHRHALIARNHMWDVPNDRYGHWNTSFPYVCALVCDRPPAAVQGDRAAFVGGAPGVAAADALHSEHWPIRLGRHYEPIAAMRLAVELPAGQSQVLVFCLTAERGTDALQRRLDEIHARMAEHGSQALEVELTRRARASWLERLAVQRMHTPDESLDHLCNLWLRYQAISGRLWARCGYYQQSGAYGFRDQLQDSQVWLPLEPGRCRQQILLHAAHQLSDGKVYHWWHPLTESGERSGYSDDLLWLAFVTAGYLKETGDRGVLDEPVPFADTRQFKPLIEHIQRAFEYTFARLSPRGLPRIGTGDWNDGLSAAGRGGRGESIWLAEFLVGLLADFAVIYERYGDDRKAAALLRRRELLIRAINEHGWDGQWYLRATLDDGTPIGSHRCRRGKIYLNAQTWAILHDVATPERAASCWAAVKAHLICDVGALLLAPAYDEPDERIGYITRYAPGLRENGGVYTHAATWALAAACRMRDAETVERLLVALNPANKDPDRYCAEPYVTPGNVDGPDSPLCGRAGWTWYTGSAAWLERVVTHFVLGVRPEWDGLKIDPVLPAGWDRARLVRRYRGCTYEIRIERDEALAAGAPPVVIVDGVRAPSNVIAPVADAGRCEVHVRIAR